MSDVSKHCRAVATRGNALPAQHDTTGITPDALLREDPVSTRLEDEPRRDLHPQSELVPKDYRAAQGPGPALSSTKPETVPLNCDVVGTVPVVLTTTTNCDPAGTVKE